MNRKNNKRSFTCKNCDKLVPIDGCGTRNRNHCPKCLMSIHLDNIPGDRKANCGGIMEPISVWARENGEWAIIHRCRICGKISSNRIAADDNIVKLLSIAVKPLSLPPFQLEYFEELVMSENINIEIDSKLD